MGQVLSWLLRLRSCMFGAVAFLSRSSGQPGAGGHRFVTPHDFQSAPVFKLVKSTTM